MNHQDIADRIKALGAEESAALKAERARIGKERDSLVELCGGIGHIYIAPQGPHWFVVGAGSVSAPDSTRVCAVCAKAEA